MKRTSWIPLVGGAALGWAAGRAGLFDNVVDLFVERPEVARLTTVSATSGGITLSANTISDQHLQGIAAPGIISGSTAILFIRTTHSGKVRFTVRFAASNQHLISHEFSQGEVGPRSWHVFVPPNVIAAHDNELILARAGASEGSITFSDVAILYRSDKLTVRLPPVLAPS